MLGTAAVAAIFYYNRPVVPVPPTAPFAPSTAVDSIAVHVSGEVVAPGLVEISASGRVADAIAAAGGTTSRANLAAINLATPLRDGEQIVVPSHVVGAQFDGVDDGRVHLNRATAAQLEEIPGVGPVLAERIIAVRSELGGFESVEDLLDVPGIGEAKLAAMRDIVVVP